MLAGSELQYIELLSLGEVEGMEKSFPRRFARERENCRHSCHKHRKPTTTMSYWSSFGQDGGGANQTQQEAFMSI